MVDRVGTRRWRALIAVFTLVLAPIGGCREAAPIEPVSVSDTVERGPLSLTVEVSPAKVWIGDPLTIELRVHTPEDHLVQFPANDEFGELEIRNVETSDPRPGAEGGLLWKQTVSAESLMSGTVEIPALTIKYARKPEDTDAEPTFENELTAAALQIEVRSALTTQESVFEPRDITGTLTPPREPLSAWTVAAIAGAVAAAIAGIIALILWLERRARRPAPPILPEVWALRALADLQAANLLAAERAKEYYYRLSEIVRVYIERKFALAAPEMTTEEFLNTLARNRGALPYDADRLRDFLQACDLVKYAALTPLDNDAEQALGTARAFIDATAAAAQQRPPVAHEQRGGQAA